MLKIRQQQIDELTKVQEHLFHCRVLKTLRDKLARLLKKDETDEVLLKKIALLHQKAKGHGITTERAVFKFISLGFAAGHDFDSHPEMRSILGDRHMSPQEKVDVLLFALRQQEEKLRKG